MLSSTVSATLWALYEKAYSLMQHVLSTCKDSLNELSLLQLQRDLEAYQHILKGFDTKCIEEFRIQLKMSTELLAPKALEQGVLNLLVKGAPITAKLMRMMAELIRRRLNVIIVGLDEIMISEEDVLEVNSISLQFSPVLWEDDGVPGKWKWSVLLDKNTNMLYDQIIAKPYDTQVAAKNALEEYVNAVDKASLIERATLAWKAHNRSKACLDIQGTERMEIYDGNNNVERYLFVFMVYGRNQLKEEPAYQKLIKANTEETVYGLLQELEILIRENAPKWIKEHIVMCFGENVKEATVTCVDYIGCEKVTGPFPMLGMLYCVVRFDSNVTDNFIEHVDNMIFASM
jgi:hypothetical protein